VTKRSEASSPAGGGSTSTRVKEQGSEVATGAAQAGKHVMQTAAGQGGQVAREAGRSARGLVDQAQTELKDQAGMQQKRVAEGLRMLGDQLRSMAENCGQPGMATDLVDDASGRIHRAADWLEQRQPGQVVEEVRDYARHHPAAFLLGSAMAGMLVGRLTRNLAQADGHGGEQGRAGAPPAPPGGQPQAAPPVPAAAPPPPSAAPTPASSAFLEERP
jgi:hypothetical protein